MITVPVRQITHATPRTRLLNLDLRAVQFPFAAGQAVMIGLSGSPLRKPYSIASAPWEVTKSGIMQVLVQVEDSGGLDPHLELASPGTPLDLEGPFGSFGLPERIDTPLLFIAGGTGIQTLFIRESLETMGVTKPTHRFWRPSRMKVHRNAKTNAKMRQLIAIVPPGLDLRAIAAAAGISVRTVAKWVARVAPGDARRSIVAPASPAAATRRRARGGDRRAASHPCHRLADQRRAPDAALDGHARLGARRPQSRRAPRAAGAGPALRMAARRRSAPPRSQTAGPRRRHRASHPWRPPPPRAQRRLGVSARRHR